MVPSRAQGRGRGQHNGDGRSTLPLRSSPEDKERAMKHGRSGPVRRTLDGWTREKVPELAPRNDGSLTGTLGERATLAVVVVDVVSKGAAEVASSTPVSFFYYYERGLTTTLLAQRRQCELWEVRRFRGAPPAPHANRHIRGVNR